MQLAKVSIITYTRPLGKWRSQEGIQSPLPPQPTRLSTARTARARTEALRPAGASTRKISPCHPACSGRKSSNTEPQQPPGCVPTIAAHTPRLGPTSTNTLSILPVGHFIDVAGGELPRSSLIISPSSSTHHRLILKAML